MFTFIDDLSIVASEKGKIVDPFTTFGLREYPIKETHMKSELDNTWQRTPFVPSALKLSQEIQIYDTKDFSLQAERIDSWMLVSSVFAGLEVTSQCDIRA